MAWAEIRRAIALRYPFMPSRGRVPLLQGATEAIPEGRIVETRHRLRVKVQPDWMYHDVYYWGDYEPYHTKIFRLLIEPGDTVFDIGANFGWFTGLFADWVGPNGRVHAFEPVPFIHTLAEETLAINELSSRVTLNPIALGRARGVLTLRTYAGLPHGHATAADLGRDDATEHVSEITTLDDYCAKHGIDVIDFMKVDVEGFEPDVFAGGRTVLGSPRAPVVAFEINSECLRARSLASRDVIAALRDVGYSEFYGFSTRAGVRRLTSDDLEHGDCLAAKTVDGGRLARALRANRVLR
jgi:FkbM family methyltransferase